eukprot:1139524-Pelagomonas_calceolata.AAC.3
MSPTGSVEQWLGVVEKRMRSSVRQQIIESLKVRVQPWSLGTFTCPRSFHKGFPLMLQCQSTPNDPLVACHCRAQVL